MTDRVLQWELPPVSARQLPHDVVRIEFRADPSFDWTALPDVPAADLQFTLVDVNPGTMFYKATLFDTAGKPCKNPSEISVEAPYDAPGDLLSFTATDTP